MGIASVNLSVEKVEQDINNLIDINVIPSDIEGKYGSIEVSRTEMQQSKEEMKGIQISVNDYETITYGSVERSDQIDVFDINSPIGIRKPMEDVLKLFGIDEKVIPRKYRALNWYDLATMYFEGNESFPNKKEFKARYDKYGRFMNEYKAWNFINNGEFNSVKEKIVPFFEYVKSLGDDWIKGIRQLGMWSEITNAQALDFSNPVKIHGKDISKAFVVFGDIDVNGKIEVYEGGGSMQHELGDLGAINGYQIVESIVDAITLAGEKNVVKNMLNLILGGVDERTKLHSNLKKVVENFDNISEPVEVLKEIINGGEVTINGQKIDFSNYKFMVIPIFQKVVEEWFGGISTDTSAFVHYLATGSVTGFDVELKTKKQKSLLTNFVLNISEQIDQDMYDRIKGVLSEVDKDYLEKIAGNLGIQESDPEKLISFFGGLFYKIFSDATLLMSFLSIKTDKGNQTVLDTLGLHNLSFLDQKKLINQILNKDKINVLLGGLVIADRIGVSIGKRKEFGRFIGEVSGGGGFDALGVYYGIYGALLYNWNKGKIMVSSLNDLFRGKKAIYFGVEGEAGGRNLISVYGRAGLKLDLRKEIAVRDWLISFERILGVSEIGDENVGVLKEKFIDFVKEKKSLTDIKNDLKNISQDAGYSKYLKKFVGNNLNYLTDFISGFIKYLNTLNINLDHFNDENEKKKTIERYYNLYANSYILDLSNNLYISLHGDKSFRASGGGQVGLKTGTISTQGGVFDNGMGIFSKFLNIIKVNTLSYIGGYANIGFNEYITYQKESTESKIISDVFATNGIGSIKKYYTIDQLKYFLGDNIEENANKTGYTIKKTDNYKIFVEDGQNGPYKYLRIAKINTSKGYQIIVYAWNTENQQIKFKESDSDIEVKKDNVKYTLDYVKTQIVTPDKFDGDEANVETILDGILQDGTSGLEFKSGVSNVTINGKDYTIEGLPSGQIIQGTISIVKYHTSDGSLKIKLSYDNSNPSNELKVEYNDLEKPVKYNNLKNKLSPLGVSNPDSIIEDDGYGYAKFQSSYLGGKLITHCDDFKVILDSSGNIQKVEVITGKENNGQLDIQVEKISSSFTSLDLNKLELNNIDSTLKNIEDIILSHVNDIKELENDDTGKYGTFMAKLSGGNYAEAWKALKNLGNSTHKLTSIITEIDWNNDKINGINITLEQKVFIMNLIKRILAEEPGYKNWTSTTFKSQRGTVFKTLKFQDNSTLPNDITETMRNGLLDTAITSNFENATKEEDPTIFGVFTAWYRRVKTGYGGHQDARHWAPTGSFNIKVLGDKSNIKEVSNIKDFLLNRLDYSDYDEERKFIVDYFNKFFHNNGLSSDQSLDWSNIKTLIKGGQVDKNGYKIKAEIVPIFFLLAECANESIGFKIKNIEITKPEIKEGQIIQNPKSNQAGPINGIKAEIAVYNNTNEYAAVGYQRGLIGHGGKIFSQAGGQF